MAAACFSGGCAFGLFHRPGVLVFGWMGLSGGWGPLPIPGARFPVERILIDQFVSTLLGHARHDGPQQGELVRCVLAVRRQQAGDFTRCEMCHVGDAMRNKVIWPATNTVPVWVF